MTITQMKNTLIRIAFTGCILTFIYLFFEYLLPMIFPFVVGFLVAYGVVQLTDRIRPDCRWLRLMLVIVIYGGMGVIIGVATVKGVSAVSDLVNWLPQLYESKLAPLLVHIELWVDDLVRQFDPSMVDTLDTLSGSMVSGFNNLFASFSGFAVDLLSAMVTAVPSGLLSALAMIISTCFVAADYEKITEFLTTYMPEHGKRVLSDVKSYLTDTLFVVIRSYLLIMMLTFLELSILFSLFGITNPIPKAVCIALLDILPILGTGTILIPWGILSMVLGHTILGVKLLAIYGIVAMVRNYAEPKIVGAQLGLHPIITLVSMFVGLRLFGFWGMFGIPVAISYFWKQKKERDAARESHPEPAQ